MSSAHTEEIRNADLTVHYNRFRIKLNSSNNPAHKKYRYILRSR